MKKIIILCVGILLLGACSNSKLTRKMTEKNEKDIQELKVNVSDHQIKIDAFYESDQQNEEIAKLRQRIAVLEEELRRTQNQLQLKPQPTIVRVEANNEKPEVQSKINHNQIYEDARNLYLKQRYDAALRAFRSFIEQYPDHDLAANCQYWIGETYYDRDQFELAINEFQKVIDFYHSSSKAPDAQLKVGLCYKQLGRPKQALLEFSRIRKMYPGYERQRLVNDFIQELQ